MNKKGGIGPTSAEMFKNSKNENLKFSSMDPADGSPVSNTPGFHSKRLKWRNTIEPQEKRSLIIEILNQVFLGKTNFSITGKLADKIGCSKNLGMDELNWLKKQDGYKKIYGEARSNFLQRKNQR